MGSVTLFFYPKWLLPVRLLRVDHMFSLILLVLHPALANAGLTANTNCGCPSAPVSDKACYGIFPMSDTDHSDAACFIASTVCSGDLEPGSTQGTARCPGRYSGQQPARPGKQSCGQQARYETRHASYSVNSAVGTNEDVSATPEGRRDAPEWIVFPANAANDTQANETALSLKPLTGAEPKRHSEGSTRKISDLAPR